MVEEFLSSVDKYAWRILAAVAIVSFVGRIAVIIILEDMDQVLKKILWIKEKEEKEKEKV
jgi:hypothetical protein